MIHELKCWQSYYEKLADGTKTFDVRRLSGVPKNIMPSDFIMFIETVDGTQETTGRALTKQVTYILRGPVECCDLPEGVVIFALH